MSNSERSSSFEGGGRWRWWPGMVIFAGILAIYLPGLGNLPVFDDRLLTSGEIFARYGSLLEPLPRMFSYGSFVWVQALAGEGWWIQRLVNVAIHASVVLALWLFYREVLAFIAPPEDPLPSPVAGHDRKRYADSPVLLLALGVFALNPVAVYGVAYLIQRSILLATLFVVLALWSFMRGLVTRRALWFAGAVAAYVLAVMSKEHAVMAPLAAVPLYVLAVRPSLRKLAVLAGGGLVLAGIMAAVLALKYGEIIGKPFDEYSRIYLAQLAVLGADVEANGYLLSILNQTYFFFKYGVLWFLPNVEWMSIDLRPPFPLVLTSFPHVLGALGYLAILVAGAVLVLRYRDGRALLGLVLLLPAILFMTEFSTVWVQDPFVLYRSYLWAIGVPGMVFFLLHGLSARNALLLGGVLGLGFVALSFDRVQSLSTPERVWSDAIAKLPDDPRSVGRWFPYLNRAELYIDAGRYNEAAKDLQASSGLGDQGHGLFNMGALYGMVGQYQDSLASLEAAEKAGFRSASLSYQRAVALHGLGRPTEAYAVFEQALQQAPSAAMRGSILAALAKVATDMGNKPLALQHLAAAVDAEPGNHQARYMLAMAYLDNQDPQRARTQFDRLIKAAPAGPVYYGRALANFQLKNKSGALADLEAATRLEPSLPELASLRAKLSELP